MGGGTVWKGVARLVSPAVRAASASTSASTSCSFCKIGSSAQAPKAQSARLQSCACTPETTPKVESVSQQAGLTLWEQDEWEFAEEERLDHLVFGSLPSRREVEAASTELQSALRLGLVAPASDEDPGSWEVSSAMVGLNGLSGKSSLTVDNDEEGVSKPLVATQMALDWLEPPPISTRQQRSLQVEGRNNVGEAFHQFQHNPEVQSMVVSLATDQAVWDAVLANPRIQEFKRKLQGDQDFSSQKDLISSDLKDETKLKEHSTNFFIRCQAFWQDKMSYFMDVLSNIINGFFKAADKKVFAEEDGDYVERTVKSCTMLALVVVCVVILKRMSLQAA